MRLLNNIFNTDDIEINKANKRYSKILIVIIILITSGSGAALPFVFPCILSAVEH